MLHLGSKPLHGYRDAWRSPAEQKRFGRLYKHMSDNGIILSPSGLVALSTPMGEAEVDRLAAALTTSLKALREDERGAG